MATPAKSYYATGRRKTSAARVFLKPGTGKFTVNGLPFDKYLTLGASRIAMEPLVLTGNNDKVDATITVKGGGPNGQAGAIRHAFSRALTILDAELRGALKKAGMLTRDSREVERKKYGLRKARRRSQFSKR